MSRLFKIISRQVLTSVEKTHGSCLLLHADIHHRSYNRQKKVAVCPFNVIIIVIIIIIIIIIIMKNLHRRDSYGM